MAVLETFAMIFLNFLFPPFVFILTLTLVLAAFGRSLGIRRLYVEALLKVFEYGGNLRIAHDQERQSLFNIGQIPDSDSEDEDDHDSGCSDGETSNKLDAIYKKDDLASMELAESRNSMGDLSSGMGLMEKEAHKPKLNKYMSRHNVISRKDNLILKPDKPKPKPLPITEEDHRSETSKKILQGKCVSLNTFQRDFELSDVFDYVKTGVASIIEDEVTQRFVAEELKNWNFLTRTSGSFEYINMKLTLIWVVGCFVRYCILLPGRIAILIVGLGMLISNCFILAWVPHVRLRQWLYTRTTAVVFRIVARAWSIVLTFHNIENRPKTDGICVANHTSPIDVIIMACDMTYSLVGQAHGGFNGLIQRTLSRAADHVWFQRSETKDRALVANRLKEHVDDPNKLPILIFPEGTCINNTSVMQFKKGSFEVGGTIYPVAIKYDPKFGDAFWNSSEYSMVHYLYMMMTSWAIVCDVWYLPPMVRGENEDAIKFANRVKNEIAKKGGLVDLMWDGNLKRQQVKSEWKAGIQQEFSQRIKVD